MKHESLRPDPLNGLNCHISLRSLHVAVSDAAVGYQVAGSRAGPSLLVVGLGREADVAFRRILALPNLPWLRGTLSMMCLEDTDRGRDAVMLDQVSDKIGTIDGCLHVTGPMGHANEAYWTILRFCAGYGMISGRGVPKRPAAPEGQPLSSLGPVHSAL